MRTRTLSCFVAAAAMLLVVLPASASSGTVPLQQRPVNAPCAAPSYVGGLGWTCPGPDGMLVLLMPDGRTGLTHGGDPVPGHLSGGDLEAKPRNPACVKKTDREFHIQAVYVHPSDQGSRYLEKVDEIRLMIRQANGLIFSDAKEFNRKRMLRVACTGSKPSVLEVQLPSVNARQNYSQVLVELRRAGYAHPLTKYLVYYDGRPPDAPGGTALMPNDSSLSSTNQANYGPYFAVSWGIPAALGGAGVLLHELGHTMGAVQDGAPNSTRAAHCNDGQDIMCYYDGGPAASYRNSVCTTTHFDCRHNDYFHPNPPKKNYLRSNWNTGSPLNRFMAGCSYRTGILQADPDRAEPGVHLGSTGTMGVPRACRGHRYALTSNMPPLPAEVYETIGLVPNPVPNPANPETFFPLVGPEHRFIESVTRSRPSLQVCFFNGSKRLKCSASDTGTVPKTATKAQVRLQDGAQALWVLSID